MNASRVLIIGSRGLLGRALSRELRKRGVEALCPSIRWGQPQVHHDLEAAYRLVSESTERWTIFWAAGVGATHTSQHEFDDEVSALSGFADVVGRSASSARGTVFFASSAGALYAGSMSPPFHESTQTRPLSPYGHTKLALEQTLARLTDVGVRVAIGRIANLYGPGQNLTKAQGLISQLCLSLLTNRPLSVYVPMDTLRDYIYVDDAAALVVDFVDAVAIHEPGWPAVIKIISTGQALSVAEVLGELRLIAHRRAPLILASSPLASSQALDLRFRSAVMPELDRRPVTPFPVGLAKTLSDVRSREMSLS